MDTQTRTSLIENGFDLSSSQIIVENLCHYSDLIGSILKLPGSFHYFHSKYKLDDYPQEFIIKILETANKNLKNICLDLCPIITFDIFSAILNYCTKITKLSLYYLSPEQVIAIFNNNSNEGFNANELLSRMAENVPKSLETIEIRMDYDNPWKFSADSLENFFGRWCKGR
ncbi:4253_t:CDS:2 [Diversispora eburnea]|uniref:4253_t:CDS:1 n=1 Tax=Diversispora eburnea TaxID=1213867 RepID=A0A9N9G2Q6_9GLOM|nr:4253_t:CDS:2 [Diversispora eburnea]